MARLTRRRFVFWLCLFGLFALAATLLAPWVGAEHVPVGEALRGLLQTQHGEALPVASDILINLRLPRILLALLAGAGLALAGVVFQALLRNVLATPYTLGVDSGGALGAVSAIFLAGPWPWIAFRLGPFSHVQVLAFAGSSLAIALIYLLARGRGNLTTLELLLAGVTLGTMFSALILAVRYFASPNLLVNMDRWTMGGLDVVGYYELGGMLPFYLPGMALLLAQARGLDQLAFGAELAQGRGVNVGRLRQMAFLGASLVTAAIVSISGPIGFVGLIVPHAVRRLTGPDHRLLMPCAMLGGGGFLVLCDMLARTIIAPTELPVGILTSLLGGPFFLYLLFQGRHRGHS